MRLKTALGMERKRKPDGWVVLYPCAVDVGQEVSVRTAAGALHKGLRPERGGGAQSGRAMHRRGVPLPCGAQGGHAV